MEIDHINNGGVIHSGSISACTPCSRDLSKYEEAMRKKDERRVRLQIENAAMLVVIGLLSEELSMLRKSYEKDSQP